jgi:hypothetical protein
MRRQSRLDFGGGQTVCVSVRRCMKTEFLSVAVLLTSDACTTVVWLTEQDHTV